MQNAKEDFEAKGIHLAAISYDSSAILHDFAARKGVVFPLLSDPESATIQRFGLLDVAATGIAKGVAHEGFLLVDNRGVVKAKFFGPTYTDQYTANNVLTKLFPGQASTTPARTVQAPHVTLALSQSDARAGLGTRVTLRLQMSLPPNVHVYAPGVQGYKPIRLELMGAPEYAALSPQYPHSKMLSLPAINETVPVFEGTFTITQDVTFLVSRELAQSLGTGRDVSIQGNLDYQACDDRECFLPVRVPVEWKVLMTPLDRERVPEPLRRAGQ